MKKYLHLLERLGLRESEREIYLYLLQYPYKIVADIAKHTRYHRPMIYKSLRALESDGLVERSYLDGKRYHYHVTSPEKLRDKLRDLTQVAERLIPELEESYSRQTDTPILSLHE